jgi:hypothetical protein
VWSIAISVTLIAIGLGMAAMFFSQAYRALTCT